MIFRCLFEQSGVFKNAFRSLGFESYDYDILNDFNETDYICDLFSEINRAYENKVSIFDSFKADDMIIAFFPCTYFEVQSQMWFSGHSFSQKEWSDKSKLKYCIERHSELHNHYVLISKLVYVCLDRSIKLVIENPYTQPHYLTYYWCFAPHIIDLDRRDNGDYYKKPTQYFFFGFKPKFNLVFEPLDYVKPLFVDRCKSINGVNTKVSRSLIHPQYAIRFIRQYLVDGDFYE